MTKTVRTLPYKVDFVGLTDKGLVRENNEDFWDKLSDYFFILADGMGGHQAGEVASKEAVHTTCDMIEKNLNPQEKSVTFHNCFVKVEEAMKKANKVVYQMGREDYSLRGMGTTLCCLYFHPEGIVLGNVGDSRIYRLRGGELEQLTIDHSLLADLEISGQGKHFTYSDPSYRNIITKAIGTEPEVVPTIDGNDVEENDLFLLCSDGLTDLLAHHEIEHVMNQGQDLEEMSNELIRQANAQGGFDNITVLLVKLCKR